MGMVKDELSVILFSALGRSHVDFMTPRAWMGKFDGIRVAAAFPGLINLR